MMSAFLTDISSVATVLGLLIAAFTAGVTLGSARTSLSLNKNRELERFNEIYAPLIGLFTTCHITISSGRGAPYIEQRLRIAQKLYRQSRKLDAFIALFDQHDLPEQAEAEYGDSFPLFKITKHLQGREKFADDRLIALVSCANRARVEEPPEGNDLTAADLRLYYHLSRQHRKLARRFVGGS